ncbi:MAG: hypothetical protein AB7K41_14530 [Bdellovibrionales bacterium]
MQGDGPFSIDIASPRLSISDDFPPHQISPTHEHTLEAAFLLIHELLYHMVELKRRIRDLENGR